MKFLQLSILVFVLGCGSTEKPDSSEGPVDLNQTDTSNTSDTNDSNDTNDTNDTQDTNDMELPAVDACETSTDCDANGSCIPWGGANVCQYELNLWYHECEEINLENDCCDDSHCSATPFSPEGYCAASEIGYCGGPQPPETNECHFPQCFSDSECGGEQSCGLAGVLDLLKNSCIESSCLSDSDCTDGTDGRCSVLWSGQTCPEPTLSCTYSDADCRRAEGCPNQTLCVADNSSGGASCMEEVPPAK